LSSADLGGDTIDTGSVAPGAGVYAVPPVAPGRRRAAAGPGVTDSSWADSDDVPFDVLAHDGYPGPATGGSDAVDDADGARRHRLVVIGLPLLALIVVVALAWWVGSTVLDVTDSVDDVQGSTPSASAPANGSAGPASPAGTAVPIVSGKVFDPFGDGEPENDRAVPLAYDDDPATSWSTLEYRGSPAFGNLKDGVGLLLDLGGSRNLSGVTLSSTVPGANVEIRTAEEPAANLDGFSVAADGTVEESTDLAFEEPVTARFVLVWITGLVPTENGFSADISDVTVNAAG
jgi:hypothetical protein